MVFGEMASCLWREGVSIHSFFTLGSSKQPGKGQILAKLQVKTSGKS